MFNVKRSSRRRFLLGLVTPPESPLLAFDCCLANGAKLQVSEIATCGSDIGLRRPHFFASKSLRRVRPVSTPLSLSLPCLPLSDPIKTTKFDRRECKVRERGGNTYNKEQAEHGVTAAWKKFNTSQNFQSSKISCRVLRRRAASQSTGTLALARHSICPSALVTAEHRVVAAILTLSFTCLPPSILRPLADREVSRFICILLEAQHSLFFLSPDTYPPPLLVSSRVCSAALS